MINNKIIEDMLMNDKYKSDEGYLIRKGNDVILISAPHSVTQYRDGKIKKGEFRTGSIAEILHKKLNTNIAIKTKNLNDDANYDKESIYKNAIRDFILNNDVKLLLDIHIASPKRKFHIDIGTGYGKNIKGRFDCLNIILDNFKKSCYEAYVDNVFAASNINTVSAFIAETCNIPTFQFEINWNCIENDEKLFKFIECMEQIIDKLREVV